MYYINNDSYKEMNQILDIHTSLKKDHKND